MAALVFSPLPLAGSGWHERSRIRSPGNSRHRRLPTVTVTAHVLSPEGLKRSTHTNALSKKSNCRGKPFCKRVIPQTPFRKLLEYRGVVLMHAMKALLGKQPIVQKFLVEGFGEAPSFKKGPPRHLTGLNAQWYKRVYFCGR